MPSKTELLSQELAGKIAEEGPNLQAVSESEAQDRQGEMKGWSRKEELGHLIDSATNNRVRFATAALAESYTGPSYDGESWVRLGGYAAMTWDAVIHLWTVKNQALARLIANIPDDKLETPCQIGSAASVTLGFLIEDYILHMQHHLDHVIRREVSTSYPGAARGV